MVIDGQCWLGYFGTAVSFQVSGDSLQEKVISSSVTANNVLFRILVTFSPEKKFYR